MNLFKSLETVCCCCFSLPFLIVKFRSLFNLEPSKTTIKVKKNVFALFTSLHIFFTLCSRESFRRRFNYINATI